jgi:hypothetical protein
MRTRLLLVPLATVGLALGVTSPAQAEAPGSISTWNQCASVGAIPHKFGTGSSTIYQDNVELCHHEGETAATGYLNSGNPDSEPIQFWTGHGWCTRWTIDQKDSAADTSWTISPIQVEVGGASAGHWTGVYPGSGYTKVWMVSMRNYHSSPGGTC